jgi:phosphoglycolate phosphatase
VTAASSSRAPGPIKGVLFDKDGTLFDFFSTWKPIYEALAHHTANGDPDLARRLLDVTRDPETGEAHPLFAAGSWGELATVWGAMAGHAEAATLEAYYKEYAHRQARPHPVTDLPALFLALRSEGLRLGIATMDSFAAALRDLQAFGIASLVDFVAGYDSGHGLKPSAGMAGAFCRTVGLRPSEIIVVGDTLHDLQMARAAGAARAVAVLTGASPRRVLEGSADDVLASIAELPALLREHSAEARRG